VVSAPRPAGGDHRGADSAGRGRLGGGGPAAGRGAGGHSATLRGAGLGGLRKFFIQNMKQAETVLFQNETALSVVHFKNRFFDNFYFIFMMLFI
jgi:hypothetical protein